MTLTLFLLALAAVFFWAGFMRPPDSWQHRSQAAFVVLLALAGLAGYFAWREARTVGELAELVDPVPEITDVTYVPSAAEVAAISQFLASVPGERRLGTTQGQRRDLAQRTEAAAGEAERRGARQWLLKTALSPDSVAAFYRHAAPRRGWTVETDDAPWLLLARGDERLVLFVTDDFPRPGTKVLYGYAISRSRKPHPP
jgi:hypothetical protein